MSNGFLLDMNILASKEGRSATLAHVLASDDRIVLTDVLWAELLKNLSVDHGSRREWFKRAFGNLRGQYHRVAPALAMWEATRHELRTGRPLTDLSTLQPDSVAVGMRELIRDLVIGRHRADFNAAIEGWMPTLESQRWNHERNKTFSVEASAEGKRILASSDPALLKEWRGSGAHLQQESFLNFVAFAASRTAFAQGYTLERDHLKAGGNDEDRFERVLHVATRRSVWLSNVFVSTTYLFNHAANGGANRTRGAEKFTNDDDDAEYIAMALAGDFTLVSNDGGANAIWAASHRAMDRYLLRGLTADEARGHLKDFLPLYTRQQDADEQT